MPACTHTCNRGYAIFPRDLPYLSREQGWNQIILHFFDKYCARPWHFLRKFYALPCDRMTRSTFRSGKHSGVTERVSGVNRSRRMKQKEEDKSWRLKGRKPSSSTTYKSQLQPISWSKVFIYLHPLFYDGTQTCQLIINRIPRCRNLSRRCNESSSLPLIQLLFNFPDNYT